MKTVYARILACVVLLQAWQIGLAQVAVPSTFGTTVGYTLLCLNPLNEVYFREYFTTAFGAPYKREGNAYWYKANATLWGVPVSDVLVSDESSHMTFLAAVIEATPEKLDDAVIAATGIRHGKVSTATHPIRQSNPGSQIVYFNRKAKIFCAKSRYLLPN